MPRTWGNSRFPQTPFPGPLRGQALGAGEKAVDGVDIARPWPVEDGQEPRCRAGSCERAL
jgi:hypothetical protein